MEKEEKGKGHKKLSRNGAKPRGGSLAWTFSEGGFTQRCGNRQGEWQELCGGGYAVVEKPDGSGQEFREERLSTLLGSIPEYDWVTDEWLMTNSVTWVGYTSYFP